MQGLSTPAHEVHAAHAEGIGPCREVSAGIFKQLLHTVSVCLPWQLVHGEDVDDGQPQLVCRGPLLALQQSDKRLLSVLVAAFSVKTWAMRLQKQNPFVLKDKWI